MLQINTYTYILLENALFCVLCPILVRYCVFGLLHRIDNRGMFSIPICNLMPALSGSVVALVLLLQANILQQATLEQIWKVNGPWHEPRAAVILVESIGLFRLDTLAALHPTTAALVTSLICGAAVLNFAIAGSGWRSGGAIRGAIGHMVIAAYHFAATVFVVLLILWLLHWLNFWAFLVALLFIEIRRREERGIRLSF